MTNPKTPPADVSIESARKEITDNLYKSYGTDSGIMFGIKDRQIVETIVQFTLDIVEKSFEELKAADAVKAAHEPIESLLKVLDEWKTCDDNFLTKSKGFEVAAASQQLNGKIKDLKKAIKVFKAAAANQPQKDAIKNIYEMLCKIDHPYHEYADNEAACSMALAINHIRGYVVHELLNGEANQPQPQPNESIEELLREVVMRGCLCFPENEQDLKWQEDGLKNQPELFIKITEILELGKV